MDALPLINADRLQSRLAAMAQIGARPDGGVDRQALSAEDRAAIAQLIDWGGARDLSPSFDQAGNLFLHLDGADPALPPMLIGSHLDSQPTGGRFDGVFGVLAALEVLETLQDAGITPDRSVMLVAWMNEEGSRFAPGMMGSEVFAGVRSLDDISAVQDARGITVADDLSALRAAFPDVAVIPPGFPVDSYVEAHIEQADLLERAGAVIGAVTGIQGKKTFEVTLTGAEAHAGTEPMARRRDALLAFARIATAMEACALAAGPDVKFTIGRIEVRPNAPSVVPSGVRFRIDLRHPDNAALESIAAALETAALGCASPCAVAFHPMVDAPSNGFDPAFRQAILDAAAARRFPAMPVLSFAGHDARHLAAVTRAAMIFVPCRNGLSHHPDEWAEPSHLAAGTQILADIVTGHACTSQHNGEVS